MKKPTNYLFLAGLFLVAYLVIEFTDIYGDPAWFKAFLLFTFAAFLVSGISGQQKEKK